MKIIKFSEKRVTLVAYRNDGVARKWEKNKLKQISKYLSSHTLASYIAFCFFFCFFFHITTTVLHFI